MFPRLEAWDDNATFLMKYFEKGKPGRFFCEYIQKEYEKDGETVKTHYFRVNSIEFVNRGGKAPGAVEENEEVEQEVEKPAKPSKPSKPLKGEDKIPLKKPAKPPKPPVEPEDDEDSDVIPF